MFKLRSIQEVDFLNWWIYFETQKYTWSRFFKFMYLSSKFEVYLKQTFNIDVFILKLWGILEVDFLNLWIYVQTQKYIWSRFPKINYFFSNSEVYLKYTSFQKKLRSIDKVLLKYKQSIFLFFSVFLLYLYFLKGSSLKACFYWTSRIWSINEVYLKYTSHIVFSQLKSKNLNKWERKMNK